MSYKLVLFTMNACGHCKTLKSELSNLIQNGSLRVVDLSYASDSEMALFNSISPQSHVPALAIISGGRVLGSQIGKDKILGYISAKF